MSLNREEVLLQDLNDLEQFWMRFLSNLPSVPTLVLLQGPMGVGKTESVRQILKILEARDLGQNAVSSPTFALHRRYQTASLQFSVVEHFDLYRLETDEELDATGFWDFFSAESHLILVEWADRVSQNDWPFNYERYSFYLDFYDTKTRRLTWSKN